MLAVLRLLGRIDEEVAETEESGFLFVERMERSTLFERLLEWKKRRFDQGNKEMAKKEERDGSDELVGDVFDDSATVARQLSYIPTHAQQ